jgi:macrolide transport system ATP-binding/permease protein
VDVRSHLHELASGFGRDLKYGARLLSRALGFTAAATVCLGIGIGLATSMYTQFQASVFKRTPGIGQPDGLVSFQAPVSFPDFEEYRDQSGQFESATAFLAPVPFVMSIAGDRPERIWGHIVTPNYFDVLHVGASAGRLFGPDETRPDATGVVISHRLWTTRFGASRDLIGGTLSINGQLVTVLGVAGPEFRGATPLLAVADIWLPTTAAARIAPELQGDVLRDRAVKTFLVTGRLKAGAAVASAEAALDGLARRIEKINDEPDRERGGRRITLLPGGRVFPIRDQDLPKVTSLPAVMVGLILVVACANVATMLVARAAVRQREIAIRLSLGGSRARLVRQLLTESMLLGLLGGAAGLLFTVGYLALLSQFTAVLPSQMLFVWQLDWHSLVAAYLVAGFSTVLFGLAPALQAARADITPALKSGAASQLRRYRWFSLRNILILQQIAASLTLLLVTAFVVVGLYRSKSNDPGFKPGNLFMISVDPVRDGRTPAEATEFFEKLPERVRRISGVTRAALAQTVPFGLNPGQAVMASKSEFSGGPKLVQSMETERVGAGFFETLGVPVLAGRTFREADERGASNVAIVNQTMALESWPRQDALGQTLELDGATYVIVGVVGDIGSGFTLEKRRPCVYRPNLPSAYARPSAQGVALIVRAEPGADIPLLVRREVGGMLPNLTVFNVTSVTEQVARMASILRMTMGIYGGIGAFGLVLSSVGLAGVTAYAVARRTHEIGVRRALGAQNRDVIWLVLREGLVLVAVGTAFGLVVAFAVVQAMSATLSAVAELTKTSIGDPLLLAGAPLLLAALALLACYLPARRSVRINPVDALRSE